MLLSNPPGPIETATAVNKVDGQGSAASLRRFLHGDLGGTLAGRAGDGLATLHADLLVGGDARRLGGDVRGGVLLPSFVPGRWSGMNGCVYLAGAPLGTYWMVRPSARAAGDAMRRAHAACHQVRARCGKDEGRGGRKEVSADRAVRLQLFSSSTYPGFRYPLFPRSETVGSAAKTARRAVRAPQPLASPRTRDRRIE